MCRITLDLQNSTDDNPSKKDNESSKSDIENESDKKLRYKQRKPFNITHHSHSNSETYSDNTFSGTTGDSNKHHIYNKDFTPFDRKTVLS